MFIINPGATVAEVVHAVAGEVEDGKQVRVQTVNLCAYYEQWACRRQTLLGHYLLKRRVSFIILEEEVISNCRMKSGADSGRRRPCRVSH